MFLRFVPERCVPQMRASAAELWVLSRTPLECPPIATGGGGGPPSLPPPRPLPCSTHFPHSQGFGKATSKIANPFQCYQGWMLSTHC